MPESVLGIGDECGLVILRERTAVFIATHLVQMPSSARTPNLLRHIHQKQTGPTVIRGSNYIVTKCNDTGFVVRVRCEAVTRHPKIEA